MSKPDLIWQCRDRTLTLGPRALVMGILNVTPDSFSDGGLYADPARAIERGLRMIGEGAAIVDIGGESSRPGAARIGAAEEADRILPVVEALAGRAECAISVDTTKADVARQALAAGAHIVNDITALAGDPGMPEAVRSTGAGAVLMHMQGTPQTMQADPRYDDVVGEVAAFLTGRVEALVAAGIAREALVVDPGIGFGKTVEHNVALLARLDALAAAGRPVLVGVSRKSFLGKLTGRDVGDRLAPSLAAMAYAIGRGARIVRVHDVKESCEIARLLGIFDEAKAPP